MNDATLINQSVKKKRLLLTLSVLFSLFISENVFAQKHWEKDYVDVRWHALSSSVLIKPRVYDYSFGSAARHGCLEYCKFEASSDGDIYCPLMELSTDWQRKTEYTKIILQNKLKGADIRFLDNVVLPLVGTFWYESEKKKVVAVRNSENLASATLGCGMRKSVRSIRITGRWKVNAPYQSEDIIGVVYEVKRSGPSMLKSDTPGINTLTVSKNDTVKLFKDSESIFIKGAELGSNVKVYTTSGVEIKSVISNNDVVKINLPIKQIYNVHIGKARYKIAM